MKLYYEMGHLKIMCELQNYDCVGAMSGSDTIVREAKMIYSTIEPTKSETLEQHSS